MDFNINIKKTENHKQETADGSKSLSFSPVASPSSETEKKVLPEPIELQGDGDIQLRSFTEKQRNLAFELAVRCIVFPGARSNHAISIMRDGLFPVQKALDVADHMLPLCISSISTSSLNIWHELQQLYANAGKNPTYRPEFFENSRKYLLWMRQEELEIDTIIENLKKEPTYQGRLFVGIVEAANLPLNDKGQPVSRPFVLIKVRGSSTVLNTKAVASWAPVWAEDFQLDISDATSDLTLELWDKGAGIGTDYLIGQAIFPLSTLSTQLPVMGWFPVKPKSAPSKNGKVVKPAELHVKLHYTHRIIPPFTSDKGPPAAASAVLTYMQEAKDSYRVLLEQITSFENPTWDQDGVVPFSPDMDWLLTEFGKRYRLGKVHRHLEYLELLVQLAGRMKKAHTENIIENIQIIEQLFVMDDCHVMRPEADALDDIKQQLKFKLERTLSKYSYAFPGAEGVEWKRGALRAVIVLYKELERTAFSQKLANLATGSMDFTYNVLKQHYENPGEFSALCDICSALTTQIQADATTYAPEFKPDLDLVKLSVDTYYTLFRADVESTLEGDLPVSTETFSLYTKLNELHIVLEKLLPGFQGINLAGIFTKYLIMWVHEAKKKLETWCSKAIEVDTWERSSTEQLHSTSVVDIFTSCTSAVRYLVSLDLSLSEAIILFAKASCSIFELYTQKMLKSCVQDIIDAPKALEIIEQDHPDYDLSLQVKQKLCVRVNNIEMAREYLDDYSRELEKYVDVHHSEVLDQCTKATLKFLRQKFDELLDIIIGKMNVYMQQCIINLLQNPPPLAQSEFLEEEPPEIADKLQPLFTFINNQLDLFSESLYHSVFIKVLRRVWFALIKDLELFLFPETQEPQEHENVDTRNSQANIIVFLLDKKLIPFFHANGEGLPLNSLKTQCALLKRELELFNVPTPQLMEIYRSIEEVEDEPANEGTVDEAAAEGSDPYKIFRLAHLLSILSSRANDERTPKFVKAKAAILSSQNLAPLLRNTFKLPSGEALVAKYECLNNVGLAVQLYITTNHVCIDSIFANRKIIIPVKAIDVLKKVQGEKLTEKLEGIKVKTGNEEAVLYFTQNRKKAYQQIEEQAHLGGNNRIGEPKSSLPLPSLSISSTPVPESPAPLVSPLRNMRTEQFTKLKNSFSLPSGESLKTCYTCSLIASVPPGTPGELFITNAGVYFYGKSMGSEAKESFSFSDLKSLTKKNAAFIFSNAILMKTSKKELFFGSFANRDEVYYILEEMWDKCKNQLPPPPPDAKIPNETKSK